MRTTKQQAASQRRSLAAIKKRFGRMSVAWGGLDGYFESRLEEMIEEVKKLDGEMAEYIADGENDGSR